METIIDILVVLALLVLLAYFILGKKRKQAIISPLSETYRHILQEQVEFYKKLDPHQKTDFENRVQSFLAKVRITGIKTSVEDIDKVLIASSAIIPIFSFPGWEYVNLNEILLYPDAFGDEFEQEGQHRNTLGMVGSGAMNNVMLLSQDELRQAFLNKTSKTNLAIHEFVHLVDKMDGTVDGIPEFILERKYILPWLELMQQNIGQIIAERSDINPYGATNKGEFFAVVAEYFFERPDLLKTKHPELYELLTKIFHQQPLVYPNPK